MSRVPEDAAEEKTMPYDVPSKPWEVVGTDIFMINKKNFVLWITIVSSKL